MKIQKHFKRGETFTFSAELAKPARAVRFVYQAPDSITFLGTLNINQVPQIQFAFNGTGKMPGCRESQAEIPAVSGKAEVSVTFPANIYIEEFDFLEAPCQKVTGPISTPPVANDPRLLAATDMLGRELGPAGPFKKDRYVAMFYWTWREFSSNLTPRSIMEVQRNTPEAMQDYDHATWRGNDKELMHWDEPLYGYYRNSDPYVIKKHMIALSQAGVDLLILDCTNGPILWFDGTIPLMEGMLQAKADGIPVPKIVFMLNFAVMPPTNESLRGLYQDIYKPGAYQDLWFYWDGKPLILAYSDSLGQEGVSDYDTALIEEIKSFFTFRKPQPLYGGGQQEANQWGWLEIAPQNGYNQKPDGRFEEATVGVAQNANPERICTHFTDKDTFGRSYTFRDKHGKLSGDSYLYGYNFQEQWDNAIAIDPDLVFVTGWNEWTALRLNCWPWITDPNDKQSAFVDQFDNEHSRDIEFDKNNYHDTYYLQLMKNVRRFKSQAEAEAIDFTRTTVSMDGFGDWDAVGPTYYGNKGATIHRDWDGLGDTHYTNLTGRNNIVLAKTTQDDAYTYFYAEAAADLTASTDVNWMNVLVKTGKNPGWEGYDIRICAGGVYGYNGRIWEKLDEVQLLYEGNRVAYRIGKQWTGDAFEFKWMDNIALTDIMNFYTDGDCAPFGRLNFVFGK